MQIELPDASTPLSYDRKMSNEEFEEFCFANPELVIEREPSGKLKIMSPVSFNSGDRESEVITDLKLYARKRGGKALSSSTGFKLPDSSVKSPDACYVTKEQVAGFTKEALDHFAPIVPVFVVEVVSPTDSLAKVEDKVRKSWIANGVKLAWLIDVDSDRLWIYREDGSVDIVSPLEGELTGEDVLPGFTFDLALLT